MELKVRKLMANKFTENPSWSGSKVAKALNIHKSSICRYIKRYKDTLSFDRKAQVKRESGTKDTELKKNVLRTI